MSALWSRIRGFFIWLGSRTLWQTLKAALVAAAGLVVLFALAALVLAVYPNHQVPLEEPVQEIVYLDQGWGSGLEAKARQAYYYTPQGTSIKDLRYSWLVHLEEPASEKRFTDPERMRSFGFLVDLAPTPANPFQLPVGFAHHFDNELQDEVLDLTCAACHTGQLNAVRDGRRVAIRIDGGEAMHAFTDMNPGDFIPSLLASMAATYLNPFKFSRFAKNVLGPEHYAEGKSALHAELGSVLAAFLKQGWNDKSKHLYPVHEGYGRTDAIGRIANTVFGDHISAANYRKGDAPVSYPPVWDIWKFNWVQYGASVRHPLARNVGEGMGVGTKYNLVDPYGGPIPAAERYQASTMIENLGAIERTLWELSPPRWPENILGKIDCRKAAYGKVLFRQYCVKCHGPRLSDAATLARDAPCKTRDTNWIMSVIAARDIGTDPQAALNFANNRLDLTPAGLTDDEARKLLRPLLDEDLARRLAALKPGSAEWANLQREGAAANLRALGQVNTRAVSIGAGLNIFGLLIREQYRNDQRYKQAASFTPVQGPDDGYFGEIDLPQDPPAYKARPLAGIWATPPFLHNGSVPNLYELLLPAEKRTRKFLVGTKDFDPVRVGYVLNPLSSRGFVFDAAEPGNSNSGHEFKGAGGPQPSPPPGKGCVPDDAAGLKLQPDIIEAKPAPPPVNGVLGPEFTDDQRWALIEYLKIHRNNPDADEFPADCHCAGTPAVPEPRASIPSCPAGVK